MSNEPLLLNSSGFPQCTVALLLLAAPVAVTVMLLTLHLTVSGCVNEACLPSLNPHFYNIHPSSTPNKRQVELITTHFWSQCLLCLLKLQWITVNNLYYHFDSWVFGTLGPLFGTVERVSCCLWATWRTEGHAYYLRNYKADTSDSSLPWGCSYNEVTKMFYGKLT